MPDNNQGATYQEWECPRCHRVNAVWVSHCPCGPYVETVTASTCTIKFKETIFSETELWDRLSDEAIKLSEPTNQPDLATAIAAMTVKLPYSAVAEAIADHQNGRDDLPGTMRHQAVIAWRAACKALEIAGLEVTG